MQVQALPLNAATPGHAFDCLSTVSENLALIKSWFDERAGRSADGTAGQLQHIMQSGVLTIHLDVAADVPPLYSLIFTVQQGSSSVDVTWDADKLEQFVKWVYLYQSDAGDAEATQQLFTDFLAKYKASSTDLGSKCMPCPTS